MNNILNRIGKNAKQALKSKISTISKNNVLKDYYKLIKKNKIKIINQNKKDIRLAKYKGLKENFIKRLELNDQKISGILKSIKAIIKIKDPVNSILNEWKRPNGLKIKRVTIPIGVIGVIYESRPNVTSDVSILCFKSGNSVILRGGSEAYYSNKILADLFQLSLKKNKINKNYVQFISSKRRNIVDYMLSKMTSYFDVIIPRGGKGLVKKVQQLSTVPVIGHLEGICHTYIDKDSDNEMALNITLNAKLRNTSICGATETLLIHQKKINSMHKILRSLEKNNCEIIADNEIKKIYKGKAKLAGIKTWKTEHLSPKISVKLVKNIDEAINHINKYGTMHTDAIISSNFRTAEYFIKNVKSSIAIHNSSTQFADGGEFGFGGEVGISTNKLPPRGPVGLGQLVSYKYEVYGSGQIRK
tara:strand:+ start:4123 stop:5370 length:1248 start_codon:yes stop_codon:yes gene_type:complete